MAKLIEILETDDLIQGLEQLDKNAIKIEQLKQLFSLDCNSFKCAKSLYLYMIHNKSKASDFVFKYIIEHNYLEEEYLENIIVAAKEIDEPMIIERLSYIIKTSKNNAMYVSFLTDIVKYYEIWIDHKVLSAISKYGKKHIDAMPHQKCTYENIEKLAMQLSDLAYRSTFEDEKSSHKVTTAISLGPVKGNIYADLYHQLKKNNQPEKLEIFEKILPYSNNEQSKKLLHDTNILLEYDCLSVMTNQIETMDYTDQSINYQYLNKLSKFCAKIDSFPKDSVKDIMKLIPYYEEDLSLPLTNFDIALIVARVYQEKDLKTKIDRVLANITKETRIAMYLLNHNNLITNITKIEQLKRYPQQNDLLALTCKEIEESRKEAEKMRNPKLPTINTVKNLELCQSREDFMNMLPILQKEQQETYKKPYQKK